MWSRALLLHPITNRAVQTRVYGQDKAWSTIIKDLLWDELLRCGPDVRRSCYDSGGCVASTGFAEERIRKSKIDVPFRYSNNRPLDKLCFKNCVEDLLSCPSSCPLPLTGGWPRPVTALQYEIELIVVLLNMASLNKSIKALVSCFSRCCSYLSELAFNPAAL